MYSTKTLNFEKWFEYKINVSFSLRALVAEKN